MYRQNIDTNNYNEATTSLLQDQTENESSASSANATFTENEVNIYRTLVIFFVRQKK